MKDIIFPESFEFGVSNASAQVEDQLNDPWMKFARQGKSAAFLNHKVPEEKIKFWTEPEREIKLAQELGVKVFRMSVDWQRLVPSQPELGQGVVDQDALERYKEIVKIIHQHDMKCMMTLFHHSLPQWAIDIGGWPNKDLIDHFVNFSLDVFNNLNESVDYWNTFNEPNVFSMFTYVAGIWPPGKKNITAAMKLGPFKGNYFKAMENISNANNNFYDKAKEINSKALIGVAHNTAYYEKGTSFSGFSVNWSWKNMNFLFLDRTCKHMDFLGFNYYGSEFMTTTSIHFNKHAEYNDAGRAINPWGLFEMIRILYEKYQKPIFITENGTADEDDILRSAYLSEHLRAVHHAIKTGIPVMGYIQWSLSDNFEWADGYGPKFGLCSVDRENNLNRIKKDSFYFFQEIVKSNKLTREQSQKAWQKVENNFGKKRKMYRGEDCEKSLDEARIIQYNNIDWRFKDKAAK